MANAIANYAKGMFLKGQLASSDTFKILLMKSGFVFDKDTHQDYADVIASEVANGLGYTTGGVTLTGAIVSVDTALNVAKLLWDNPVWTASGGPLVASGAIIYDDSTLVGSGDDYTDAVISYIDFGGDVTITDGLTLKITNAEIILA